MRIAWYIPAIVVLLFICIIAYPACAAGGGGGNYNHNQFGLGEGKGIQHGNGAANTGNAMQGVPDPSISPPKNSQGKGPVLSGNSAGNPSAGPSPLVGRLTGTTAPSSSPGNGAGPVRSPMPRNPHSPGPWHSVPVPVQDRYPCGPAETSGPLPAGGPAEPSAHVSPGMPRVRREEGDAEDDGGSPPLPGYPVPAPFLPALGYRRITRKTVLASSVRNRVYTAIAENPGLDAPALAALLGMNINTLRYHLFTLAREEKITYFSRPGTVRYFVNNGLFPPRIQCHFHYLRGESTRKIILALAESPGMTREALATTLGIAGPSVTRHIQNLSHDGIVEVRKQGRFSCHYLTPPILAHPAVIDGCSVHPYPSRESVLACNSHLPRGSPAET